MASDDSESKLPGLPGYDPHNLQPWTVQLVVSMTILALVAIGLRLVSRRIQQQKLWWDDKMIMFSMCWNLVVVGFIMAMYSAGMGIHADKVDPADIVMMTKWLVVAEILYVWNLAWTKMSLLLMYYRIFRLPYYKSMAWAVGAFVWAWVICITLLDIFTCIPVQKLWHPQIPGRCINQVGTWTSNAASTIFTDLVILFMPLPQIWKLRLRTTKKIGLTLAFSLGFFVVFASAYRTSVLFTYTNTDPTYTLAPTAGWTIIEMSAGIVSACLPTLLPIVLCCARAFGFTRTASVPSREADCPPTIGGSGGNRTKSRNKPNSITNFSTRSEDNDSHKGSESPLYQLPDGTESDSVISHAVDARSLTSEVSLEPHLRADMKGYGHSVKATYMVKGNRSNNDDIPLQGIRVQKEFKSSTSRRR